MARDLIAVAMHHMGGLFEWGAEDCCCAACDAFEAVHGIDPMARIRDAYHDKRGALRLMRDAGGLDALAAQLADVSGLRAGFGGAGEIGVSGGADGRRGLVFCVADGLWVGKADEGFRTVASPERSWRV